MFTQTYRMKISPNLFQQSAPLNEGCFACDTHLHSEKDFLQMTCEALHLCNLLLQLISQCDSPTLKTTQSNIKHFSF